MTEMNNFPTADDEELYRTDGGLRQENEGKIINNPRFVCDECGYANVVLIDAPKPAAKCTNCGVGYIEVSADV